MSTRTTTLIIVIMLSGAAAFAQPTPAVFCTTESAFAVEVNPSQYLMDLICQPLMPDTLELEPNAMITVTISLANYYAATGGDTAAFDLHFAMDRARLLVREPDALQGIVVTDATAALVDLPITTSERSYTLIIENRGLRSAVFDLSVRPNE